METEANEHVLAENQEHAGNQVDAELGVEASNAIPMEWSDHDTLSAVHNPPSLGNLDGEASTANSAEESDGEVGSLLPLNTSDEETLTAYSGSDVETLTASSGSDEQTLTAYSDSDEEN